MQFLKKKIIIFALLIRIYQVEKVKQERMRDEIKETGNPSQKKGKR